MRLEYKENKIRDFVVYETSVVPLEIDVERHYVLIVFKSGELEKHGLTADDVRRRLEDMIPRKLVIEERELD